MSKIRLQTVLVLGVLGVCALLAFIVGLFAYRSLTATPLHPDAQRVPSVARSKPSTAWADTAADGRQIVRAGLTAQNLPGISIAIGVDGEIVWAEGFGWANLEDQVRVTPDTRFRTGDVSKALTSAAVGLLLERGRLELASEIQTYVPDYPKKEWPVTLRHLMGQVAGLRDDAGDEASLEPCERTLDGLRLFADHELLFEPGTKYHRSSYGWILVSAAVESAAPGQSFFTFMRTQVFEPLGMGATRPDSASEPIPDRATFYFPKFAGDNRYGPQDAREGDHSCYAGAGAFLSTPSDLVRFGMAINAAKLLQPDTVTLLQTPQRLRSGEETGYALGWTIETLPLAGGQARMAGHGTKSDFIGATAYLMTFPERGIAVAVMSNTAFGDAKSIALHVAEAFAARRSGR